MMKSMGREIASGVVFLGGVALVALTAESIPVLAGVGAVASLGAGIYQAVTAASSSKAAKESTKPAPSTRVR